MSGLPQLGLGVDDDLPPATVQVRPIRRRPLEALDPDDGGFEIRHLRRTAKDLPQRPCAACGRLIVAARDASLGGEVLLEPVPVYLEIGTGQDGVPLMAHAANGLARHHCPAVPTSTE